VILIQTAPALLSPGSKKGGVSRNQVYSYFPPTSHVRNLSLITPDPTYNTYYLIIYPIDSIHSWIVSGDAIIDKPENCFRTVASSKKRRRRKKVEYATSIDF
jgi:hypothetical protein